MKESWINQKLVVGRYPMPSEIKRWKYDIIINVSDEYIESCHTSAIESGKMYFWFPLTEITNMGLNSIYAALQILFNAEMQGKSVYMHCHAGTNRSPTVRDCYQLMMCGQLGANMEALLENIELGVLPPYDALFEFLASSKVCFELEESNRGGKLDKIKHKISKNG